MHTKEELKTIAISYLEKTYSELIEKIINAMLDRAENGYECLYRYFVNNEDEARAMARYFKAKGFITESSWLNFDEEKGKCIDWYVNIFWW